MTKKEQREMDRLARRVHMLKATRREQMRYMDLRQAANYEARAAAKSEG